MNGEQYTDPSRLLSVDFEVDGVVQGEFFRKYAYDEAMKRGLKGWLKNTRVGTIQGVLQGDKARVAEMKHWLYAGGSPRSLIQGCLFQNEREIINYEYPHFQVDPSDW